MKIIKYSMLVLNYYRRTTLAYIFHLGLSLLCLADSIFTSDVCRSSVYCFECNSGDTPTCGDPFNRSHLATIPLIRCHGCCIKLVRWKNTPQEIVYRMCSSNRNLEIDQSLIDHVCLAEWKDSGTLCFCEHDRCNQAPPYIARHSSSIIVQLLFLLPILLSISISLHASSILGYE